MPGGGADRRASRVPRVAAVLVGTQLAASLVALPYVAHLARDGGPGRSLPATAGRTPDTGGAGPSTDASPPPARLAPARGVTASPATAPASATDARLAAVRAVLDRRASAVLRHDRAGFLATVDPAGGAFRTRQAQLYANLAAVPLGTWSYAVVGGLELPPESTSLQRYRTPTWAPAVTLTSAIRGFDATPVAQRQYLTFVQRAGRWYLGGDDDGADYGYKSARGIWDFGPLQVVRGRRSLVIGHPSAGRLLRLVSADVDAAVPRVDALWGSDWARRVVVLVPASPAELGKIINNVEDLGQIAAVATADLAGTGGGPAGDRVVVNPGNFAELSALGRRIVLQHEITHVATRRATRPGAPTWLVEGFADYVGYSGQGVSVRAAAAELARDVRRGRLPDALPVDDEFHADQARLAQAYEEAWLACRLIALRTSPRDLVRFYRTVGGGAGVDQAFRRVLRTDTRTFTAAWRANMRAELS